MRISRKKRPKKPLIPNYKVNERIKAEKVRLIDSEGEHIGVTTREEALKKAREQGLDLVAINPTSNPIITKIVDFAHFKYQKAKEARKQKNKSKISEVKGVRLSIRIGKHDLEIRRKQAEKFLKKGNKVKVEIILRGAEKGKGHLAHQKIRDFFDLLSETIDIKFEQESKRQGHKVSALIVRS